MGTIERLLEQIASLKADIEKLEKEADWLAEKLEFSLVYERYKDCNKNYWRTAAKNATS